MMKKKKETTTTTTTTVEETQISLSESAAAAAVCKETNEHKDEMIFGGSCSEGREEKGATRRLNLSTKD